MSFIPTTPDTVNIPTGSANQAIDTFRLAQLDMRFPKNQDDKRLAIVTIERGFMDAGTFVFMGQNQYLCKDASFLAALDGAPSGATNQAVLENLVFAHLIAAGVLVGSLS